MAESENIKQSLTSLNIYDSEEGKLLSNSWMTGHQSELGTFKIYAPKDNYIHLYHLDKTILLPVYPDNINDKMNVSFKSSNPLLRSAPIYSYSDSGPRSVSFSFTLHRDLMYSVNSALAGSTETDYLEELINHLHAMAVPKYQSASKIVDPPIVAVRIADQIFIKGVVVGGVSVNYQLPLINFKGKTKYSMIEVSFSVEEFDSYDASIIAQLGSFRGYNKAFDSKLNGDTSRII